MRTLATPGAERSRVWIPAARETTRRSSDAKSAEPTHQRSGGVTGGQRLLVGADAHNNAPDVTQLCSDNF